MAHNIASSRSYTQDSFQIVRVNGVQHRIFTIDVALRHQRRQGFFHAERAGFLRHGNFLVQLMGQLRSVLSVFISGGGFAFPMSRDDGVPDKPDVGLSGWDDGDPGDLAT